MSSAREGSERVAGVRVLGAGASLQPMAPLHRRSLLASAGALGLAPSAAARVLAPAVHVRRAPELLFAVKYGMVGGGGSMAERFARVRDLGFDGIELDSPNGYAEGEVAAAREATGLPVHGVVDSTHWNVRLSDPDPEVRTRAVADLRGAIQHAHAYGGSAVLLVPGAVRGEQETQENVWSRSIEGIRQVLPLCARLGIHVLIENVWNGFCYQHGGPEDQTAETLRDYLDAVNSPWVGSYFDIGNHQKYGRPADWIRTLGSRIVKLDVKDWGKQAGFSKIGAGDVDWEDVRAALGEIGYTGWATAEVGGGDVDRLAEVHANMTRCLRTG